MLIVALKRSSGTWLLLLVPGIAFAADNVSRAFDGTVWSFWVSLLFVQILAFVGWGASSWSQLAGWPDGTREVRYRIVQGIFASALAANVAYYGVYYVIPEWGIRTTEIGSFISAALASWSGEKFLTPLGLKALGFLEKVFNLREDRQ